ncbi:uncharacterized protein METZ01_LOCUS118135 [marine metagenome]|uniref:Prohead core protein n=1 Tax=marine metagenome TaxID=408172 RepID=A0A381XLG1_9ZZZZ
MSEEILNKESEEMTEEELAEKAKAAAEQDSSDGEEDDEEEVEEGKSTKASVKKEEDDEEEEEEPEVAEGKSSVKKEEGEEEEEGDEDEEEVPAESKKAKKESVIPSTKNQMLKNIYDEVNKMLKSDLAGKYEQIMASTSLETVKEVKEETRTQAAVTSEDIGPINVQDDIEALTAGEEGLSEDFKSKATTIFEAAVHAKVVDEVNARMEQQAKEQEAGSKEFQKELTEKVDGYLTYVVEEWMKENELAIERGIRSELVEDFMSGLKTLFAEHYIDIPEEKVDMVDDLFTKVEDLESSLDEEINRGVELQKELAQFKKDDALKQSTKDLADTDSEKIAKLAEGIEFENTEQYIEKLNVLKESYFPKTDSVTSEITETDDTIELTEEQSPEKIDESMKHYTSAIKRYNT